MKGRSLFSRLLAANILVLLGAFVVLGVTLDRILEHRAVTNLKDRLVAEARTVQAAIEVRGSDDLQPFLRGLGASSGARLTVIRIDGVVLADSEHDPRTMGNHATRPEVRAALRGHIGSDQRLSDTLGRPFLYVALPPLGDVLVRAALPATTVASQRNAVRKTLAFALLGTALVAGGVSALIARSIARPLRILSDHVAGIARGESTPLDVPGPKETQGLANAVNQMATELATRLDELQNETELREQILSSMSEGVLLADTSGALVYANPAVRNLLGGVTALPPQVTTVGAVEFAVHHPERRDIRSASLRLADGRTLVVMQDITDARRVEAMRRDFVANASHELKTPVGGILATAETLARAAEDDPKNVPRFAGMLLRESRRLSRLVEDLLDLARMEQQARGQKHVSLSEVVRQEVERVQPAAEEKGLSVQQEIDGEISVVGTEQDLALAVRNLLDNAVRYTTRGTVSVRLSARDSTAVIEVADTGNGIAAKHLPRIFERFYRVDPARSRETGGTGLGLSIVRHVAESHGGRAEVKSELGKGSSFTVTFPKPAL